MRYFYLPAKDSQLGKLVKAEITRQEETLNLVASENIVYPEILELLGSPLTNKYSEGYPGKRYYPGTTYYDQIEVLAQDRALKTFGLSSAKWAVNVQPYSGTVANLAIYTGLLHPGDTLMGLNLASGGHLSHGYQVNLSGQLYRVVSYNVNPQTGLIDFNAILHLVRKYKPKLIVAGASAYSRQINFQKFAKIAHQYNSYLLADISHIAGLVASGLHPSPFPYCDIISSTTHKTLRGPRGAVIFLNKKSKISQRHNIDLETVINRSVFPGLQGGPHNNVVAAIALTFKMTQTVAFKKYQQQIIENAQILAQALKKYNFVLVTGGTDNHLILINLKKTQFSGILAEKVLEQANILANRNVIPGDDKAFYPSGLRLGVPWVTTLGMKGKEMEIIAQWIYRLLQQRENPSQVKKEVINLRKKFPFYQKYITI